MVTRADQSVVGGGGDGLLDLPPITWAAPSDDRLRRRRDRSKPTPLSKRELEKILAVKTEEVKPTFRLGSRRRTWCGSFRDRSPTSPARSARSTWTKAKLKVLVNIFDRETPVELSFDQVAKV
jgi:transcription antitermination factor NusG